MRDRVRVARNPRCWRAAEVALDGVDFLTVESQFTALNLWLADEVDLLFDVPSLAVPALRREHPEAFAPEPLYAALQDRELRCAGCLEQLLLDLAWEEEELPDAEEAAEIVVERWSDANLRPSFPTAPETT